MAAQGANQTFQKYLLSISVLYQQKQSLREYVELLLSLIAIGTFVVFAIKPTLVTIGDLFTKINVEQATSDALDTKIKNLGIAQNQFNANEDKINLLQTAVPAVADPGGYIRQLEGLAKKENLTIINTSSSKVDIIQASASANQAVAPTISVSGDFAHLENFLKDVESLRRPSIIQKLDFSQTNNVLSLTVTPNAPFSQ